MRRAAFILGWVLFALGLAAAELTVLATSDIHGEWGADGAGWPRIAAIVERERAAAGDDALLLIDCGDELSGSWQAYRTNGEIAVAAMNALGYDFWIPGNHDFDLGGDRLLEAAGDFSGTVLAANCALFPGWTVIERSGIRIAVVGLTSETLPWYALRPEGLPKIAPEAEALAAVMAEVRAAGGADLVILAAHRGVYARHGNLYKLLADYPDIHLALGGHSHAVDPGRRIRDSHFAAPGGHGEGVIKVVVTVDDATRRITGIVSRFIAADASVAPEPAFTAAIEARFDFAGDPTVYGVTEPAPERAAKRYYASSCGTLALRTLDIPGAVTLYGVSTRPKVYPAELTERAIFDLFPYQDQAVSIELGRAELVAVIDEQLAVSRKYPYVPVLGNLAVRADADWRVTGLEPERETYCLVTSTFLAAGGGGRYPVLHALFRDREVQFHGDLRERLKTLAAAESPLTIPPRPWLIRPGR